ncbi:MAG: hypothetical protein JXA49_02435 [Actinobacteria bacterium]|nr:hypothetical protein [Actinomycetota bacterium]
MYNSSMLKFTRYTAILILIIAVLAAGASCGGTGNGSEIEEGSNYEVRQAVIQAIETDMLIDSDVTGMIHMIRSNQLDLQKGLDDMVDRNHALVTLIKDISEPEEPSNPELVAAREKMEVYLRNRVHQFESTLSTTSVDELETVYQGARAKLEKELQEVKDLLVEYDPELEESLR